MYSNHICQSLCQNLVVWAVPREFNSYAIGNRSERWGPSVLGFYQGLSNDSSDYIDSSAPEPLKSQLRDFFLGRMSVALENQPVSQGG